MRIEMEVVKYKAGHAEWIIKNALREKDGWMVTNKEASNYPFAWETLGPGITLLHNGLVVGCGGIVMFGAGRGEVWTLLSTLLYRYKKSAYGLMKQALQAMIQKCELSRVQAQVLGEGNDIECRMLERLGFRLETPVMRKYGPNGEDVAMYVIIR